MSVYLIRHTTPLIEKGICYGQSDIDVTDSFNDEAAVIKTVAPEKVTSIYCSPLLRCRKLAAHLYPDQPVIFDNHLKEIHCGEWELKNWNDIPTAIIDLGMKDFVNIPCPCGESYIQLNSRVTGCFENIIRAPGPVVIVSHGGVMRSILSHITQTPLINSFGVFGLHYGCVVKIDREGGQWQYEMLSGGNAQKEQHKPGSPR